MVTFERKVILKSGVFVSCYKFIDLHCKVVSGKFYFLNCKENYVHVPVSSTLS